MPQNEKDELFCAYAGMILQDSELELSEEAIVAGSDALLLGATFVDS